MQIAPDPVFGPEGSTAWKIAVVAFFLGVIVARLLEPPPRTRVVRFRVVEPESGAQ